MKESLAHALGSSLEPDDSDHINSLDKVIAFSFGDRLGTLLWRVKYHNCASSYHPAVLMLSRLLKPLSRGISVRVSEQALHEWLFSHCPHCLGTKNILQDEKLVECPNCFGSGLYRFSDQERNRAIGANMTKQLKQIHDVIGEYDRKILTVMRVRLEK